MESIRILLVLQTLFIILLSLFTELHKHLNDISQSVLSLFVICSVEFFICDKKPFLNNFLYVKVSFFITYSSKYFIIVLNLFQRLGYTEYQVFYLCLVKSVRLKNYFVFFLFHISIKMYFLVF